MFKIFKRKDKTQPETEQVTQDKYSSSWFSKLKTGLSRTRQNFGKGIANAVLGQKVLDESVLEDIETILLTADIGVEASQEIVASLTDKVSRKELTDGEALILQLEQQLFDMIAPSQQPLTISGDHKPYVILMVGVNGAGKTTTIGKLAKRLQAEGKSVLLAAGDTFRAAAIEQLQVWGERNDIPVVAQQIGSDSASVIYDAIESAKARNIDVVIADTAGRLHTQSNLMQELSKVERVIKKLDDSAPHEVMLVLDAGIGQNALQQAKQFNEIVNVSGITITKLDGTAKGGILFAIANQLKIPIRFIGIGEGIEDLREFDAESFVNALFIESDAP